MEFISFTTRDRYVLQGAWLGPRRARTAFIFMHGLTGNLFSQSAVATELARLPGTACLLFNNRGHGFISPISRMIGGKRKKVALGMAHETFSDCRHDVAAAVAFAKSRGAKRIILVGHSTGCQKSVWYLSHSPAPEVKGAVFLAPLSDYAALIKDMTPHAYQTLRVEVEKLEREDPRALVPQESLPFPELIDAQRWLSLYTPESDEEIFTYGSGKQPATLRKTRVPVLALFSSHDQYADRSAEELARWFTEARPKLPIESYVVDAPDHGFTGKAAFLAKIIRTWNGH